MYKSVLHVTCSYVIILRLSKAVCHIEDARTHFFREENHSFVAAVPFLVTWKLLVYSIFY